MKTFAEATEALAANLPGYEERPQQTALAVAIENAFETGGTLLGQAGVGTGKSLGYLIPAILSGKRIIVSTGTKALQDQLLGKDLPFLSEKLGVDFSYAGLKGKSNYLCVAAFNEALAEVPVKIASPSSIARSMDVEGFGGERHELVEAVTDAEWMAITTSATECVGKKECPFGEECYAEAAKAKAADSNIVVVNHALYLNHVAIEMATEGLVLLLDQHDGVIFDEAHELPDWAANVFGEEVTSSAMTFLARDAKKFAARINAPESFASVADSAEKACDDLFEAIEDGRLRQADVLASQVQFEEAIKTVAALQDAIAELSFEKVAADDKAKAKLAHKRLTSRVTRILDTLLGSVVNPFTEWVRSVESRSTRKGRDFKVLRLAPIDVGPILAANLWNQGMSFTLVSATLASDGDFGFISGELGLGDDTTKIDVGTPFDYATQATIYVPQIADPARAREEWKGASVAQMTNLVLANGGRALVLFTSVSQMKVARMSFEGMPFTVMMQGDAPNKELAAAFEADTTSVLLATRSFFTGVDFQGDTCSLVIIDKLPFPVPTDVMVEAKTEAIEARGGNAFSEFVIPSMTLILNQAFGRLIRHGNDKGVVAILDPRLITKGYGQKIINSLPPAPVVKTFQEAVSRMV